MSVLLVFDLGSTALKLVAFAEDGRPAQQVEVRYPTRATPDGGQEQDPEDWWNAASAACSCLPAAMRDSVRAIALVGTMENLVPLDVDGRPVRPALLYSDGRSRSVFPAIRDRLLATGSAAVLGNAPGPLNTLCKFLWLQQAEPEAARRVATILPGAKDYLALRLTGEIVTDPTAATTVGLMDLARRDWSAVLVEAAGLDPALLPPIRPADTVIGTLRPDAAAALGLSPGCPVVNGCGDAAASTVGAAADGQLHVYLGTSGWVARSRPLDPAVPPRAFTTLAHPRAGWALEIAPLLTAGDAAGWFGRIAGADLAVLDAEAAAADAAPPETLFLPYLKGERSPFVDLALRGALLDLDITQGRGALHYAVLDGVALALRNNLDAMAAVPGPIRLTGGGGASRIWPQLIADACSRTVECADLPTATTAMGGYRIAAATLGWPTPPDRIGAVHRPRPERADRSARRLVRFRRATDEARRRAAGD
ncbi:xylulokinase [Inquilinus ginsengisoli]|uniref:Xylulokinase n=1 Tax=Inquilinus ginsengisoli TaxID=363840 RepID=A0ABU1K0T2_9PROT|nr:FGGY family carbohydrate kinase [Inquilinus ginsengisoli]MDR6294132.1 xylulokinase [Inquilinus ginsengisoli]